MKMVAENCFVPSLAFLVIFAFQTSLSAFSALVSARESSRTPYDVRTVNYYIMGQSYWRCQTTLGTAAPIYV